MPYEEVGNALHDHPKPVNTKGDNHSYCWSILYLLMVSQHQHFALDVHYALMLQMRKERCPYSGTFNPSKTTVVITLT